MDNLALRSHSRRELRKAAQRQLPTLRNPPTNIEEADGITALR